MDSILHHIGGVHEFGASSVPLIETWRKHYNTVRPHSSLGYLTPHEFKAKNEQLTSTLAGGIALSL